MRTYKWVLVSAIAAVLIGAVGAFIATQGSAMPDVPATGAKNSPSPAAIRESQLRPSLAATPTPAAAPAAPAGTQRVETTQYDSWAVTCRDAVGSPPRTACSASLRVTQNQSPVMEWQIGYNKDGRFVTTLSIPSSLAAKNDKATVGGPIMVAVGVDLKFGNGPARVLNYVWCGPRQCMAEGAIDEAFAREASAGASANATVTVHTTGGPIPVEFPVKGIDKAIAATRR